MSINDFIEKFAEQFDDTDASVFTPDAIFKEFDEWSSLVALSVIAMIDEEYGIALTGNEMKSAVTIQDLFNTVQAKLA